MENIITTEKLSKYYKDVQAVSDLSLNVRKGEIYGFLGLNGAGKTTTIRMMLGMIKPTSGIVRIDGKAIKPNQTELWQKVGYLVETSNAYPNLTVRENLEIIRRMRSIKDKESVDRIIDKLQLGTYENRLTKNLSQGNAQRLGLAKALIHQPEILILDEPANGLDPAGIFEIREMLIDLAKNMGVTIVISSHILGEISRLASRIGIIHNGKLLQEINTNQLEKLCTKRLFVNSVDNEKSKLVLTENRIRFGMENNLIKIEDAELINKPDVIATLLVNSACPPTLLQVVEEDLESYFLKTIETKGESK